MPGWIDNIECKFNLDLLHWVENHGCKFNQIETC